MALDPSRLSSGIYRDTIVIVTDDSNVARLRVPVDDCYVVGDAVWDLLAARRARMLCIGLLSGGYGEDELTRAGAFRVYRDPAELHASLDELGVLP